MHVGMHQSLGLTSYLDSMNTTHSIDVPFEFKQFKNVGYSNEVKKVKQ